MAVLCPASYAELKDMLNLAINRIEGPVAIRYPRGGEGAYKESSGSAPSSILREGNDLTIVAYGIMINEAIKASEKLAELGFKAEVIKLNFINPLDTSTILQSLAKTGKLVIAEDVCAQGSIGTKILASCAAEGVALVGVAALDLGSGIVFHGNVDELLKIKGLDADGIVDSAMKLLNDVQSEDSGENKQ